MDALLSLPALSFLLIPTMTSYSTSLNLLFFYLTWSTLILSHQPLKVEIVGTLAVRIIFYVIPSLFFLLFDTLLPSAAINFKSLGDRAIPETSSRKAKIRILKIAGWSLFNLVLSTLLQSLTEILFVRLLGIRSALRVTTSLPMPWGIFKDLFRGFLAREVFSYISHRYILHSISSHYILDKISTLHMTWYHSLSTPYPLTGHYDHPLPYTIHKFLSTYIPAVLFRFHLLTYFLFLIIISLEETFAYSGYSTVPTNFILGGIARRTDAHVLCEGEGNFAPLGISDWIMGTSVGGDIAEDVREEAVKHDVPERVGNGVEKAKRKGSQALGGGKKGKGGGGRKKINE
ncbi:putative sterol desaturase family [Phaeomoniella chlamydospora]|uniref:Putative sterol desaturase family n=1 Tax=Phaeomoniella chlamydospora TaxID=158046 RepID=A0A0G2EYH4_PHACM|nr:putative sterol desaturase family [Phaeomoniella chlamydospora]